MEPCIQRDGDFRLQKNHFKVKIKLIQVYYFIVLLKCFFLFERNPKQRMCGIDCGVNKKMGNFRYNLTFGVSLQKVRQRAEVSL